MDVSVILATYRRSDILSKTLKSLCGLNTDNLNWELIIIDNADDSNTQQLINQYFDQLPIKLIIETTPGKNNALNRALPLAKGKLFVFTDDDIIADSNWLIEIWEGSQRWKNCDMFGGRILPFWPEGFYPYPAGNPYLIGAYCIADWQLSESIYPADKIFGPNMAVRRSVFEKGWRFNTKIGPSQKKNYIMGSETEFVMRMEREGFKSVYLPNALVYHQIRPEQMKFSWLKKRAFRAGLGQANSDKTILSETILGVPRYIFRWILVTFFEYTIATIRHHDDRYRLAMKLWLLFGKTVQYHKNNRSVSKENRHADI